MTESVRKIPIHVRVSPKVLKEREEAAREKEKRKTEAHHAARAHIIEHEKEKLKHASKLLRPVKTPEPVPEPASAPIAVPETPPEISIIAPPEVPIVAPHPTQEVPQKITQGAEALVPSKLIIPRKPIVVEDISTSALAIAYFCMELDIENKIPTYAGGLGILAGDMLQSCADLGILTVGITLCYRKGYFSQRLDASGWQFEDDASWNPYDKLTLLPHDVTVMIEGRTVHIRAWLYKLKGIRGTVNPILFLDTDFTTNAEEDRHITDRLYSGDLRHRLKQEAVLGIGGLRMLQKIGATNIQKFHMNEGHAALLTLELYRQYASCDEPVEEVRRRAVFTTHTPIAAGHDKFDVTLAEEVLGKDYMPSAMGDIAIHDGTLNMTRLGLDFAHYVNGVAKSHREVTRELFPGYHIESITNGVHAGRWVSDSFAALYDKYLPGWRMDNFSLRYALSIPTDEVWKAHEENKRRLISFANEVHGAHLDPNAFTIGFARRATHYKRSYMLFADIERLLRLADRPQKIQIIYAGKAHPSDRDGKLMIQGIINNLQRIGHKISGVYLPDYDMNMSRLLVAGCDLWLNTPERPQEASGTSGMKAALNGVPQLSVLDGWWLEGHIEGVTGWSIGAHPETGRENNDAEDANDLYTKLETTILPTFENDREKWVSIMRSAIAINGSFFNTHRMAEQYVLGAYFQ